MATGELTEVELAIERLAAAFAGHAGQQGREGTRTAGELGELLQLQLPSLVKEVPSLEEKMKELGMNKDQELRFDDYWRLIGELATTMRREKE